MDDNEMKVEIFSSALSRVEEDIVRRNKDIAERVEALRRAEKQRAWLIAQLALLGAATQNPQSGVDAAAKPASVPDRDDRPSNPSAPFYPEVPSRVRPESEFWLRMLMLIPQAPARGWTPAQLTVVAQKERPEIANKRVRNQLDRWRKRGLVIHVDGYWCRPAVMPSEQLQEYNLMQ